MVDSIAFYQWCKDGFVLIDEEYPLLYVTSAGRYECSVTVKTEIIKRYFEVKGVTVKAMLSVHCA